MKFLYLVAVLMFIHCCSAQRTNRSSVWLMANGQIFITSAQVSQRCFVSGATGRATPTPSTNLLTTSNLAITGTFAQLANGVAASTVFVTSHSVLYTLTIQFIYNSTYSITLTLPATALSATGALTLTIANLFATPQPATPYWTVTAGSTSSNLFPVVIGGNSIMSPTGSTWLSFQNVPAAYSAAAPYSSGIVITDYISSSTIAISQWSDWVTGDAAGGVNVFYQLGVRTQTNKISSTSSTLTTAASCTVSGRKRSLDHLINKRAVCTSTASIDPSMTSSILTAACTSVNSIVDAAQTDATLLTFTNSDLQDAFNDHVTTMNAMYQADFAVFGAGSSKYAIAANFGMLIALSSIIFSFLN